ALVDQRGASGRATTSRAVEAHLLVPLGNGWLGNLPEGRGQTPGSWSPVDFHGGAVREEHDGSAGQQAFLVRGLATYGFVAFPKRSPQGPPGPATNREEQPFRPGSRPGILQHSARGAESFCGHAAKVVQSQVPIPAAGGEADVHRRVGQPMGCATESRGSYRRATSVGELLPAARGAGPTQT